MTTDDSLTHYRCKSNIERTNSFELILTVLYSFGNSLTCNASSSKETLTLTVWDWFITGLCLLSYSSNSWSISRDTFLYSWPFTCKYPQVANIHKRYTLERCIMRFPNWLQMLTLQRSVFFLFLKVYVDLTRSCLLLWSAENIITFYCAAFLMMT